MHQKVVEIRVFVAVRDHSTVQNEGVEWTKKQLKVRHGFVVWRVEIYNQQ